MEEVKLPDEYYKKKYEEITKETAKIVTKYAEIKEKAEKLMADNLVWQNKYMGMLKEAQEYFSAMHVQAEYIANIEEENRKLKKKNNIDVDECKQMPAQKKIIPIKRG